MWVDNGKITSQPRQPDFRTRLVLVWLSGCYTLLEDDVYEIPESVEELFNNGERSYSITDPEQSGDNIFAMNLFLECVGVPAEMVECDDGTQVTLNAGKRRIVIDSGGLGDFHLHGYDVTVLDA